MIETTIIYVEGLQARRGVYNFTKNKKYKIFINGKTDQPSLPDMRFWYKKIDGSLIRKISNLLLPNLKIHQKNVHNGRFTVIATIEFKFTSEEVQEYEFRTKKMKGIATRCLRARIPPKDELTKYSSSFN